MFLSEVIKMKYGDIVLIDIDENKPIETRYWTTARTRVDGNDDNWLITILVETRRYKSYHIKNAETENGVLKLYLEYYHG